MIENKLVSSKAVLAKIIADLDLKEDELKITDVRLWIGEAMEKIGAVQLLEHKVLNLPVENYLVKLPCDLYRLGLVAFSFLNSCGWVPIKKTTNSFGVYKDCGVNGCNDAKMLIQDAALIPLVKNLYNLTSDREAVDILNEDSNVRNTLSALVNQYTVPSVNGTLVIGNPSSLNIGVQYSLKPGYINLNVPNGWLKISYHSISTDEDSMPLIPDNPAYFEAIFWYVAMKLYYPKYLKGQLNQRVYYDMRNSWNFYRKQAYAEAMMPGIDDMENIKNDWYKLYPEIDDHSTFFSRSGEEQILYNQNSL